MTIQKIYDSGLFDKYKNGNAHEVLKDILPVNERGILDLEEVKDDIP